jgi:hypothetical protein
VLTIFHHEKLRLKRKREATATIARVCRPEGGCRRQELHLGRPMDVIDVLHHVLRPEGYAIARSSASRCSPLAREILFCFVFNAGGIDACME